MEQAGSRCDLFLYEGQEHGFFNKGKNEDNISGRNSISAISSCAHWDTFQSEVA